MQCWYLRENYSLISFISFFLSAFFFNLFLLLTLSTFSLSLALPLDLSRSLFSFFRLYLALIPLCSRFLSLFFLSFERIPIRIRGKAKTRSGSATSHRLLQRGLIRELCSSRRKIAISYFCLYFWAAKPFLITNLSLRRFVSKHVSIHAICDEK